MATPAEITPALRSLAPDLWVADRPFKLPLRLGDIGCRMTVARLTDQNQISRPRLDRLRARLHDCAARELPLALLAANVTESDGSDRTLTRLLQVWSRSRSCNRVCMDSSRIPDYPALGVRKRRTRTGDRDSVTLSCPGRGAFS